MRRIFFMIVLLALPLVCFADSAIQENETVIEKVPILNKGNNIYEDAEFGVRLIFPNSWFIVSSNEDRKKIQAKYDNLPSGDTKKVLGKVQDSLLGLVPVVTAYRLDPASTDKTKNDYITLSITEANKPNELEYEKSLFPLAAQISKGQLIYEPKEITVNGIKGVCGTIEAKLTQETRVKSSCIFVDGGRRYKLSFDCNQQDFSALKIDFDKVIDSLQLK
jgi:hypothetical protein